MFKSSVNWLSSHRRQLLLWGVVTLGYILILAFYSGRALTNCTDVLMQGPGDQTAGLIWLNTFSPQHPLWDFTHMTNYPYGEQLSQPTHVSGLLEYVTYWLLGAIAGPVCGYNLLNFLGFLSSAVVTFAFIRWLTGRSAVAFLAGYAVTFTPYLQIKTGVHPSYVFQALFVAILWLFLLLWRRPTWSRAVALGVVSAVSFYLDPYFILLTGMLLVGIVVGAAGYQLIARRGQGLVRRFILLGLSLATVLALILPLVYVRLHYSADINKYVSNSRNPIKFDAQLYGARPQEYFLPAENNIFAKKFFGADFAAGRNRHISNPAEYTINLSLTLVAITLFAALWLLFDYLKRRRPLWPESAAIRLDPGLLISVFVSLGLIAFAFSLPPTLSGIKLPTYYLTNYVDIWRVFARLYILVNISLICLASLSLVYLFIKLKLTRRKIILALAVIFALVAAEYQIYPFPRPVWSYSDDVPEIYQRLHDRSEIKVVAEYSLDEQPVTAWPSYYFTYQRVHGKQMINSYVPGSPQGLVRGSIRDLRDSQTLPALRTMGVQAVIIHGQVGVLDIPGLELMDYQERESDPQVKDETQRDAPELYPISLYRLTDGPKGEYVVAPWTNYLYPIQNSRIDYDYVGRQNATLKILPVIEKQKLPETVRVCGNIRADESWVEDAIIEQDGTEVWRARIDRQWTRFEATVRTDRPLTIKVEDKNGPGFVLDRLGCQ